MAERFDEIDVAPNESVFCHREVLERVYCSKIDDSESGFIPIEVLDVPPASNELNNSFNELNLSFEESPQFAELKSVSFNKTYAPTFNFGTDVAVDQNEPSSTAELDLASTNVIQTAAPVIDTECDSNLNTIATSDDNHGTARGKAKKPSPMSNLSGGLGKLHNERKRTLPEIPIEIDEEVCSTTIRRFVSTSRSGRSKTATMITQIGDRFYKSSLISVSTKHIIFRCYDCQKKTYCKIPDTAVSYVVDAKGRKRYVACPDFEFTNKSVKIKSQEEHKCNGRKEESVDFLYDELLKQAKLIIKDISDPARYTSNDILTDALKSVYTLFGRKTVKKTMDSDPDNTRHTRSCTDKIHRMLQSRREETNENPREFNESIYEDSIFQFDHEFYESTNLKLWYDPTALQYLCDSESQVQLDGTFPEQLIRGKKWVQLLKVKTYKKNNKSLIFYCAMTERTLKQYESIFDRVLTLCQKEGQSQFSVAISSSDQEPSLVAICRKYFASSKYKSCSFHYINGRRKELIGYGLKKLINRKNLKSTDSAVKLIAKSWIIIKCLPFIPKNIAKLMIDYLLHRVSKLNLSQNLIDLEKVLNKIKSDHDDESKINNINWWSIIQTTDSFTDTTTGRLGICSHMILTTVICLYKKVSFFYDTIKKKTRISP